MKTNTRIVTNGRSNGVLIVGENRAHDVEFPIRRAEDALDHLEHTAGAADVADIRCDGYRRRTRPSRRVEPRQIPDHHSFSRHQWRNLIVSDHRQVDARRSRVRESGEQASRFTPRPRAQPWTIVNDKCVVLVHVADHDDTAPEPARYECGREQVWVYEDDCVGAHPERERKRAERTNERAATGPKASLGSRIGLDPGFECVHGNPAALLEKRIDLTLDARVSVTAGDADDRDARLLRSRRRELLIHCNENLGIVLPTQHRLRRSDSIAVLLVALDHAA